MNGSWRLNLVLAHEGVEGSFLNAHSIHADPSRVFLSSEQGTFFVFDRRENTSFRRVNSLQVSQYPLTAISGDERFLVVPSVDGKLRIFNKKTLELISTFPLSGYGLGSVACRGSEWYVAKGGGEIAVGRAQVFVSQQNEGDFGLRVDGAGAPLLEFGKGAEPGKTVVFDRKTGERLGEIDNPKEMRPETLGEQLPSHVALQVFDERLLLTIPGPHGQGVFIYQTTNLKLEQFIDWPGTNCAVICRKPGLTLLIAGNENGQIRLYNINSTPAPILDSLNLRQKTNNLAPEAIEVRALWVDDHDDFIFAASSWGNEQIRSATLPSFFVLKLEKTSSNVVS